MPDSLEPTLNITVDPLDPTPPYEQIRRQCALAVNSGTLRPGARIEPVRQLAARIGVAPGTVARAYRELESGGYLTSSRGAGTRVAENPPRVLKMAPPLAPVLSLISDDSSAPDLPRTTRVGAYGLMTRADGVSGSQVLLVRSSAQSKLAGQWFLPGGGVEWGERPEDAVVRELREETGLEVEVEGLLEVSSQIYDFYDEHQHALRIIYRVAVVGGVLRPEPDGTTDVVEWVPMQRLLTLNVADFVRRALAVSAGRG